MQLIVYILYYLSFKTLLYSI